MDVASLHIPIEGFFNLMCRNANVGCWLLDLQNKHSWWSDSYYEMLGIEDKNEILILEQFLDNTVHPDDRQTVEAALNKYIYHQGVTNHYEIRLKHRNGHFNWYETFSEVRYDEDNNIQYIIGGIVNIDEAKKHEEEAERQKFFVDVAEEMAGMGIYETNFLTSERYWSETMYDIFELPYDASIEQLLLDDFYDAKDLKTFKTAIAELRTEKKSYDIELRLITAKKNTCWVRTLAKPVIDAEGRVIGLRGIYQKIEKQKLKENFLIDIRNKIKEQKFFLDETSSISDVGGWELDLESDIIYWSTQTKLIHEVEETVTLSFDESVNFYVPSSKAILLEHFTRLVETGKPYDLELELMTAKKNKIWVRSIGKSIMNEEGEVIKIRGVMQNITEQKQKEIELNLALNIINGQNEKLKDFTYIVSHNLRSHAGNLKMITEMVGLETEMEAKLEWIDLIKNVSSSLSETVNNLNGLVTLTTENKKRLYFANTFNNIKKGLNYKLIDEEVQINTDFSACEFIDYVPAYLESIMLNLITNAIKYKHPERKPIISLCTGINRERPCLSVTDNGMGIDLEAYGSRLFKMNQTFHKHSDARGIGLYITKNQVENMGGSIEVESIVNVGTTFTIHF